MSLVSIIVTLMLTTLFCLYSYALIQVGIALGRSEHNHRERLPDDLDGADRDVVIPLHRRKW